MPPAPQATTANKKSWGLTVGDTVYVNLRQGTMGPIAWVPYKVTYVFADGNASIVREPDVVGYTGGMTIGGNLRRAGETYDDAYPGP